MPEKFHELAMARYPRRTRLKILGDARVEEAPTHPELPAALAPPEIHHVVERLFPIDVMAFDWNCPNYIAPRYTATEVEAAEGPLKQRSAKLGAMFDPKIRSQPAPARPKSP